MTNATFDVHAADYDKVALSFVGREYRNRVHAVVAPLVDSASRVLDLGCGTGIDTAWLSTIVDHVDAIDPSPEMVEVATDRTKAAGNVTVALGAIESVAGDGPFDLVLANFGAINCVPSLENVGRHIEQCLAPGGHAVLVTMPHVSPVERLAALMTRNRELWGRRSNGPTNVAGYEGLTITYANASQLAGHLPGLDLVGADSFGMVLPGFEQRGLVEDRPRLGATLAWLDRRLAPVGGRLGWGDHVVAVFQKPAQ
jgi:SAM-dependent methyltransferase